MRVTFNLDSSPSTELNDKPVPGIRLFCFPVISTGSGKVTFNFDSSPSTELNDNPLPGVILSCFEDKSTLNSVPASFKAFPAGTL